MTKTRIFYYDVLRLMAIIGIIFCHTALQYVIADMGTFNFYVSSFYDCFRDFCIPIFVMLSGALLLNKKDTLGSFLKRRFSRIFVPFLFWVLIYIIYSAIFVKGSFEISYAFDIFLGKGGTLGVAFWFIWMIIIVYIAIFIINWIAEKFNFSSRFFDVLAALSVIFILMQQFGLISVGREFSLIYYYVSFINYAVIGYYLSRNSYLDRIIGLKGAVILTFIMSFGLYLYYICGYVVPQSMSAARFTYLGYFTVIILLISSGIFVMFKYLDRTDLSSKIRDSEYGKAIAVLSQFSYGIFLTHYMILHILKMHINSFIPLLTLNSIVAIPALVFLTFIVSLLILLVLNKIPYLDMVTGKN
ncbi:acyltransferase [Methanobrevibacter sp.]|uniref:acyltransferase n=1 Tax=Methanobrevibacter sp. TaxID=66852 RepID=UPI00388FFC1A